MYNSHTEKGDDMKMKRFKIFSKLLLTGNLILTGCSYEKESDWYQEYTSDTIETKDIQIIHENPFHPNQSIEEQTTYLQQLIMNNPTMTELQKYWALAYQPLLLKLLTKDSELIYQALNQLQIDTVQFYNSNLNGIYYDHLLLISDDLLSSNDLESCTFQHEFAHAITSRIHDGSKTLYSFEEAIASILADEFSVGTYNTSYRDLAVMVRMLIEIVGVEPFYDMMINGNIDSLKEAIKNIDSNFHIDDILYPMDVIYEENTFSDEPNPILINSYIPNIIQLYETKYQTSYIENQAMNYYIQFLSRQTIDLDSRYYAYLDNCYFNSEGYRMLVFYDKNCNYFSSMELDNQNSFQKKK